MVDAPGAEGELIGDSLLFCDASAFSGTPWTEPIPESVKAKIIKKRKID